MKKAEHFYLTEYYDLGKDEIKKQQSLSSLQELYNFAEAYHNYMLKFSAIEKVKLELKLELEAQKMFFNSIPDANRFAINAKKEKQCLK